MLKDIFCLFIILLFSGCQFLNGDTTENVSPDKVKWPNLENIDEIKLQELIEKLGNENLQDFEKSSKRLTELGIQSWTVLQQALSHNNELVRTRAKSILDSPEYVQRLFINLTPQDKTYYVSREQYKHPRYRGREEVSITINDIKLIEFQLNRSYPKGNFFSLIKRIPLEKSDGDGRKYLVPPMELIAPFMFFSEEDIYTRALKIVEGWEMYELSDLVWKIAKKAHAKERRLAAILTLCRLGDQNAFSIALNEESNEYRSKSCSNYLSSEKPLCESLMLKIFSDENIQRYAILFAINGRGIFPDTKIIWEKLESGVSSHEFGEMTDALIMMNDVNLLPWLLKKLQTKPIDGLIPPVNDKKSTYSIVGKTKIVYDDPRLPYIYAIRNLIEKNNILNKKVVDVFLPLLNDSVPAVILATSSILKIMQDKRIDGAFEAAIELQDGDIASEMVYHYWEHGGRKFIEKTTQKDAEQILEILLEENKKNKTTRYDLLEKIVRDKPNYGSAVNIFYATHLPNEMRLKLCVLFVRGSDSESAIYICKKLFAQGYEDEMFEELKNLVKKVPNEGVDLLCYIHQTRHRLALPAIEILQELAKTNTMYSSNTSVSDILTRLELGEKIFNEKYWSDEKKYKDFPRGLKIESTWK